jgi:DNA-binding protein H-NS
LDCYQTCQAKDRKDTEQAKKSIEKFIETMKARGITITGCKVQLKVKACGQRRKKPAKKKCQPKAKP